MRFDDIQGFQVSLKILDLNNEQAAVQIWTPSDIVKDTTGYWSVTISRPRGVVKLPISTLEAFVDQISPVQVYGCSTRNLNSVNGQIIRKIYRRFKK